MLVRLVCSTCLKVVREEPETVLHWQPGGKDGGWEIVCMEYNLPKCCGAEMLIAGEPKTDTTGVTGKIGTVIDPVDKLRRNT